jgi:F-type H+-transporting ATPase subunit epsilon
MSRTIQVDIVSLEKSIYSGQAQAVFATGGMGELGIYPGHTQLLTVIKPGFVRLLQDNEEEAIFYVNGGILEVQPNMVSILADTVKRAAELDEQAALEVKERLEKQLANQRSEFEYAKASAELAETIAQLQAIQKLRKKFKV